MKKHVYCPEIHYQQKLARLQGNDKIPDDILDEIKSRLDNLNDNPNADTIKSILKELHLKQYYENIPSIVKYFNKDQEINKIIIPQ